MMRVRVQRERCQGHARCWAEFAEVFELDDDGYSSVVECDIPFGEEARASRAVRACPERAIEVVELTEASA